LIGYGIKSLFHREIGMRFGKKILSQKAPGFLIKNVPFTNMYGSQSYGEFVLQITNRGPIRIECRGQTRTGSVDEKIPYLIGNCMAFEEKNVIVVLEGGGMRPAARRYAISAAKAIRYKKIMVMSLNQFRAWSKRMFG